MLKYGSEVDLMNPDVNVQNQDSLLIYLFALNMGFINYFKREIQKNLIKSPIRIDVLKLLY